MSEPRDPYNEVSTKRPAYDDLTARQFAPWGWVAGGVIVLLLILVFAFGTGSDGERSATNAPPASTGQAPAENTGEAPASRPATPPASQPPARNVMPEPQTPRPQ